MDEVKISDIIEVWANELVEGLPAKVSAEKYSGTTHYIRIYQSGKYLPLVVIVKAKNGWLVTLYKPHDDIDADAKTGMFRLDFSNPKAGERIRAHLEKYLG